MVLECQQHPDYQQAITTLLDLAERYGKHGRSLATDGTGTVKQGRSAFAAAEADLKVCNNPMVHMSHVAVLTLSCRPSLRDLPMVHPATTCGLPSTLSTRMLIEILSCETGSSL